MMEFKHAHYDLSNNLISEITYAVHNSGDLSQVMQEFRHFLLGCGFQSESIEEYIPSE